MSTPTGAPCWTDLLTSDSEQARTFYPQVFGWTAGEEAADFGGYFMFSLDGEPVAGCMRNHPGTGVPDTWSVYLSARDARGTADKAVTLGAKLRVGPADIADLGTEAVLDDVTGAGIGLWQPGAFTGFPEYTGKPGTPAYFELLTPDYRRAVEFYRAALGWDDARVLSDTPESRLTALTSGPGGAESARPGTGTGTGTGQVLAGIMDGARLLPAGEPGRWHAYFKVADTDATLGIVTRLGGRVTGEAIDTPYGRLAGAADPTGARFKLIS
jgi:uncharacterized protein